MREKQEIVNAEKVHLLTHRPRTTPQLYHHHCPPSFSATIELQAILLKTERKLQETETETRRERENRKTPDA